MNLFSSHMNSRIFRILLSDQVVKKLPWYTMWALLFLTLSGPLSLTVEINQSFVGTESRKGWEDCFQSLSIYLHLCHTAGILAWPSVELCFSPFKSNMQSQSPSVFSNLISSVFWLGGFQNPLFVWQWKKTFFLIRKAEKARQWHNKLNCFTVLIKRLHWTRGFPPKLIICHIRFVVSNKIKQWP